MGRSSSPKIRQSRFGQDENAHSELLLQNVLGAISTAQLLVTFLSVRVSNIKWADALLADFNSLDGLLAAPAEKLLAVQGLGRARVLRLKAVYALSLRHAEQELDKPAAMANPAQVIRYLRLRIGHIEREIFGCLYLDACHRPISWDELFLGSLNRAHVYAREILKRGLALNAGAIVLSHNHPSGAAEPSSADVELTRELKDLLARVDIVVLDHIIVTPDDSVSMANRGLLAP